MPTITFFPLGNADCYRINLDNDRKILIDYADCRDPDNQYDLRIDLPKALREDLGQRRYFDVVAFTHADLDHVKGASQFFYLEHAKKYQDEERVHIKELWVPAAMIIETGNTLEEDAKALRNEARYRLVNGTGIRVFSQPERLGDWLKQQGISLTDREHCISQAGTIVPSLTLEDDGVEFFVHSPFAFRQSDGTLIDRNDCSLALHATFCSDGIETRFFLSADVTHEILTDIVLATQVHQNEKRLHWDIFKLPHHCSYLSLSDEKGKDITEPVPKVRELFEDYGNQNAIIVSTSKPIPDDDSDRMPPHRQAANYYKGLKAKLGNGFEFKVTMEHPSQYSPQPLVVRINEFGACLEKRNPSSSSVITNRPAPRAGG